MSFSATGVGAVADSSLTFAERLTLKITPKKTQLMMVEVPPFILQVVRVDLLQAQVLHATHILNTA